MKYYLIAGEASGDLHGANLMKAIRIEDPEAEFRFWGGDLMQSVGGTLVKHYKERSFMGFIEILLNLPKILGFIRFCKKDIKKFDPDLVILIDNSGFNLPIAKWAKINGYTTHYYISPQIWASREGRIKTIKAYVDYMYVVLPFVKEFYENKHDFPVHFVGHPLIDAIADHEQIAPELFKKQHNLDDRPIIAILPGSRKQEIRKMLEVMLTVVDDFPEYQFIIAGAPSQEAAFYTPFIKKEGVRLVMNQTYDLLSLSSAALVTSGTATLETALFKVPQVVCYKGSTISYHIAKRIINLEYISLVNLIMDKPVVTELIQGDFNTERLKEELSQIIDKYKRAVMFLDYYDLEKELGGKGANQKAARLIVESLT
ncbi:lipid-A-disaccharide synthase [Aquimarina sp. D1M17]|uniref:lipid-A-disaccharide synthase n=1 Tax=Aquimarina acroporae TaxID=2937283 RepID=UPI0020BFD645|nr:lipid-A-disaccharide synthase [Aquimarina acroporae]MCK8522573.1 lipid-A-disaccharide synthase [Aquimarina acroporae]